MEINTMTKTATYSPASGMSTGVSTTCERLRDHRSGIDSSQLIVAWTFAAISAATTGPAMAAVAVQRAVKAGFPGFLGSPAWRPSTG